MLKPIKSLLGLGVKMLDVYGMTETTGAFTTNTADAFKLGTAGRPVPGIEVKIADDGEICARGPLNTPGYLNLPEQTGALLDAEGFDSRPPPLTSADTGLAGAISELLEAFNGANLGSRYLLLVFGT